MSPRSQAILGSIIKGRGLAQVPARALESPDPRQALRAVLRAWLPLSEAVLSMAAGHLPSPPLAAPTRLPRLLGLGVGVGERGAATAAVCEELAAAGGCGTVCVREGGR